MTVYSLKLITISLATVAHIVISQAQECQIRDYGNNHKVCVCNSTYCDFIPPITKVDSPNYLVYTSNRDGLRFRKSQGQFIPIQSKVTNAINVGVGQYQTMEGFGGAFTDAVGINILSLNRGAQQNLLRSYFGPDGIEYNLGRVPIGCSDFSTHGYSYDDSPSPDPQLNGFNLVPEDIVYKIPLLKEANRLSNNTLHLMGVSWTSPKWMKVIPEYIAMFGEIKRDMFQSWADYHLKFLEAYDDHNITFWGITTGNEPSIGYTPVVIPIDAFTAPLLSQWVANNLGPTIRSSKYSDIKIITLEDERLFLPWFIDEMFDNKATEDYIDGIAVHWYFDKISPPSVLDDTHNKYPDKFIIMTEACRGQIPFEKKVDLGSWGRGEDIVEGMIENFKHWINGWVDWNMALNEGGGPSYVSNYVDSPIIVNSSSQEFYKQPMFYVLGHFSKFIPRGSIRIDVSQFSSDTQTIAFKRPDGGVAIIILNKANRDVNINIIDKTKGQIPLHLTAHSISSVLYW